MSDTERTNVRVLRWRGELDGVGEVPGRPSADRVPMVSEREPAGTCCAGQRAGSVGVARLCRWRFRGHFGLYARVSSHDQRADVDRQVAGLLEWAAKAGHRVVRVEAEVGSGMNGSRSKLRRLLGDPKVTTVVVEHRDRLARVNAELVEAALSAHGRRLVVIDAGEVDDDLVGDMTGVLTSFCARLYGRRSARNRAEKALRCAEHDVGPMALSHPKAMMAP